MMARDCAAANGSTARAIASPGHVYSVGQLRELAWTRPCDAMARLRSCRAAHTFVVTAVSGHYKNLTQSNEFLTGLCHIRAVKSGGNMLRRRTIASAVSHARDGKSRSQGRARRNSRSCACCAHNPESAISHGVEQFAAQHV